MKFNQLVILVGSVLMTTLAQADGGHREGNGDYHWPVTVRQEGIGEDDLSETVRGMLNDMNALGCIPMIHFAGGDAPFWFDCNMSIEHEYHDFTAQEARAILTMSRSILPVFELEVAVKSGNVDCRYRIYQGGN